MRLQSNSLAVLSAVFWLQRHKPLRVFGRVRHPLFQPCRNRRDADVSVELTAGGWMIEIGGRRWTIVCEVDEPMHLLSPIYSTNLTLLESMQDAWYCMRMSGGEQMLARSAELAGRQLRYTDWLPGRGVRSAYCREHMTANDFVTWVSLSRLPGDCPACARWLEDRQLPVLPALTNQTASLADYICVLYRWPDGLPQSTRTNDLHMVDEISMRAIRELHARQLPLVASFPLNESEHLLRLSREECRLLADKVRRMDLGMSIGLQALGQLSDGAADGLYVDQLIRLLSEQLHLHILRAFTRARQSEDESPLRLHLRKLELPTIRPDLSTLRPIVQQLMPDVRVGRMDRLVDCLVEYLSNSVIRSGDLILRATLVDAKVAQQEKDRQMLHLLTNELKDLHEQIISTREEANIS